MSTAVAPPSTSSTIKVTHRTDRSLLNLCVQKVLRLLRGHVLKPTHEPGGSNKLTPHKKAQKQCKISERQVNGMYIYDLLANISPSPSKYKRRIYYVAGGSWQMPPSTQHWRSCAEMTKRLSQTAVSVISMPLAPESPAPDVFAELVELFGALMREAKETGEEIIFAGDSSGGNVILSVTITALQQHPEWPAPKALFAICPSTDLTRANPKITEIDRLDPILSIPMIKHSAKVWRSTWDAEDPRVSPLFADLSVLRERDVHVHGTTAGYDVLGPDGIEFRKKLDKFGVKGEWLEWERQMHCYPLLWIYGVKEGKQAFDWVVDVLSRV